MERTGERRREINSHYDGLPSADKLPPLPRPFYGPFELSVPTGHGWVRTTLLEDHDLGPYPEGEIEALFEANPADNLGKRGWVIVPIVEPTEVLLANIAREYDERLRVAGDRTPTYQDDDDWARDMGYPRGLVRHVRSQSDNRKLHALGSYKQKSPTRNKK